MAFRSPLYPAGGLKTYGSYQDLAEDPDVDVVYVNAIHTTHKDMSVLMLEHGKHVLSEKPIAVWAALLPSCSDLFSQHRSLSGVRRTHCKKSHHEVPSMTETCFLVPMPRTSDPHPFRRPCLSAAGYLCGGLRRTRPASDALFFSQTSKLCGGHMQLLMRR